jgi:hypothetical protein
MLPLEHEVYMSFAYQTLQHELVKVGARMFHSFTWRDSSTYYSFKYTANHRCEVSFVSCRTATCSIMTPFRQ